MKKAAPTVIGINTTTHTIMRNSQTPSIAASITFDIPVNEFCSSGAPQTTLNALPLTTEETQSKGYEPIGRVGVIGALAGRQLCSAWRRGERCHRSVTCFVTVL
jgi:hypothetical protein